MSREGEIRARRDFVAGEPFAVKTHSEDYGQGYGETTYFVDVGGELLKIGIADSQEKGTRYYALASFIAHAHADIPYLLDENARLQRKLVIANDAILDFMECIELGEPYRRGKEIAERHHRAVAETEEPNE